MLSEQLQVCLKELGKLTLLVEQDAAGRSNAEATLKSREEALNKREAHLTTVVTSYQTTISDLRCQLKSRTDEANEQSKLNEPLRRRISELEKENTTLTKLVRKGAKQ